MHTPLTAACFGVFSELSAYLENVSFHLGSFSAVFQQETVIPILRKPHLSSTSLGATTLFQTKVIVPHFLVYK